MAGFLATMVGGSAPRAEASPALSHDDFWFEQIGSAAATGQRITVREALRVPAVRRATLVLAGSIASLPLPIYERTADGKRKATANPLYAVIHDQPAPGWSAYRFWETMAGSLILFNDAYAQIVPGPRGAVDQLQHMPSDRVSKVRLANGKAAFDYSPDHGAPVRFLQEEVFHLQGFSLGGCNDESLIEAGKDTIANTLALMRYIGSQWKNGARLAGVLEHPGKLTDPTRLRASWQTMYAGIENSGKTAILEEGMKFRELSQKNTDAQLFEQWSFLVEEIGRLFGVPSVLLGHADKTSTHASAEQFFLSFVVHSLGPWLSSIQQAINTQLILNKSRFFAEFSVQGLLRGDHAARAAFYNSGIQNGWLMPNEARALENLNSQSGGDHLWRPLNVVPADAPFELADDSSQETDK